MLRTTPSLYALIAAALLAGCGGQAETDAVINAAQARFQAQAAQTAQSAERAMPQADTTQAGDAAATMGQPAQAALSEAEALAAPMPIPAADIDAAANDPATAGATAGVEAASGEAGTPHP